MILTSLRSAFSAGWLLVRRRARRDALLLVAWVALAAFAFLLAVAGPRLMLDTVDAGAREAVAQAGTRGDVIVNTKVGVQNPSILDQLVAPKDVLDVVHTVRTHLPAALDTVAGDEVITVTSSLIDVRAADAEPELGVSSARIRIAMLTPEEEKALTLPRGELPSTRSADTAPLDVVISSAAAKAASLRVGSVIGLHDLDLMSSGGQTLALRVVGIVDSATSEQDALWTDLQQLWSPAGSADEITSSLQIVALAQPDALRAASDSYGVQFDAALRIPLLPESFTEALAGRVSTQIDRIAANSSQLVPASAATLSVSSGFADAMAGYWGEARAATAQMSVALIGVLGVTLAVVILLARLLVLRRAGDVTLERSRGASVLSVGIRAFVEALVAGAVAVLLGVGAALLLRPAAIVEPAAVWLVVVIVVLAAPAQAMFLAAALRVGRAAPANRRDRLEIDKRRSARRIAAEVTVVALAAGALVSLAGRGLLQTATVGIDPLLAGAPLLLAAVVTIVVLRVYHWPVRLVGSLGRRTRGPLGLLGAVRAQHALAPLSLLALTLAVALTVGSGLTIDTVRAGQQAASWQRIGADVRADGPVTEAQVSRVAAAKGVTAASSLLSADAVHLDLGTATSLVTLLAVDRQYGALLDSLPEIPGVARAPKGNAFATLAAAPDAADADADAAAAAAASDRLPVVVDAEIASKLLKPDITMNVDDVDIPLHVVGTAGPGPDGYSEGPFIYVDLQALAARFPALGKSSSTGLEAGTLLVVGPGARAAAAASGIPQENIHSRDSWLREWNGRAMIAGVQNVLSLSTGALGLLGLIALVATVLVGAGERARSLSLLRTLGMPVGLGWWLALAELTPLVVAALVGGIAAGIGVVAFLGPSLGLGVLAGGLADPAPILSFGFVAGLVVASAVVLAVAVLIEVLLRRRDRLSEVLRVGETV